MVSIIIGSFLGAGFASGKEIITYFTIFGDCSYLGVIFATILLFLVMQFYFWLSSRVGSFAQFVKSYFGRFGDVIRVLFVVCIFILVATMFAGASSIANAIGISKYLVLIPTVLIIYLCNYYSLKGVSRINAIVVPFMLTVILLVYSGTKVNFETGISLVSSVSAINYVLINMLMLGMLILEIGKEYTKKEKLIASVICSLSIGVLLYLCNCGLMGIRDLNLDMPMLYLSRDKGIIVYTLATISIWMALLTSITSNIFMLDNYFSFIIKRKDVRLIFIIAIAFVISLLGFDIMVGYMYSFIGIVCAIFVICVCIKRQKNIVYSSATKKYLL